MDGPLDDWILRCIDDGAEGLLKDEQAEHRARQSIHEDEERYYDAVTNLLDVSVDQARAVCIAFNAIPFEARNTYFEYSRMRARENGHSDDPDQLRADLAKALIAILSVGGALE